MSSESLQLLKRVPEVLREHPERRFKAKELANLIFEKFPNECYAKLERSKSLTNEAQLLQQIAAEIGSLKPKIQAREINVRTTEGKPPRHYYWSDANEAEEDTTLLPNAPGRMGSSVVPAFTEYDLYPILGEYLSQEGVVSMRIDERRSSNSRGAGGNRWLYPDVVGLEDLTHGWDQELRQCVREIGDARSLLWSLEVKIRLNRSNVRESYFQAVSNSSWANFGYLVALEIEGHSTMPELRMLSALHGIGVIQLDAENPSESQILIPARPRAEVDWSSCNRILMENSDFKEFIKRVRQFYQTGDRPLNWNLVPQDKGG